MRYEDISPTMRAFLGCWEGFRKIGFSADDLYFSVGRAVEFAGRPGCYVTLRTQGREFNVLVGPAGADGGAALQEEYARVAEAISGRQVPMADLDRIWQECKLREHMPELLLAIETKGIRLPDRRAN